LAVVSFELPSSLEVIRKGAFSVVLGMTTLNLPDSVKRIERGAFNGNDFLNFRVPPLVTKFDMDIFRGIECIVSIELSEAVERICSDDDSMAYYDLRNIAIPAGCNIDASILDRCHSLGIDLDDLKERFDGLPLHEICYYRSYRDTATVLRTLRKELRNPNDNHKDCMGMTPLHILACSTTHDLEVYQMLVQIRPEYLTMEDRWGDIALLYLFWCNAPEEIIQFMVESYMTNYPQYEIGWVGMIFRMADSLSPKVSIQNLLNTHQRYFPDQQLEMEEMVLALAESDVHQAVFNRRRINKETFILILSTSIHERVNSLNNSVWRAELEKDIRLLPSQAKAAEACTMEIYAKLSSFERIKEATTLLELALWKAAMADHKIRTENEATHRSQSHANCGAEIIIKHVLPFLWQHKVVDSFSASMLMSSRDVDSSGSDSDNDDPFGPTLFEGLY